MSQIDSILGLSNLELLRSNKSAQSIEVWAKPNRRPTCLYCQSDCVRIKATYQRTLQHSSQGNRHLLIHLSVPQAAPQTLIPKV
jgi:hypothetical protein